LIPPFLTLLSQFRDFKKGADIIQRAFVSTPFACLLLQWLTALFLSLSVIFGKQMPSPFVAGMPDHIFLAIVPLTLLAMTTMTFLPPTLQPMRGGQPSQIDKSSRSQKEC
jgi:CBS domain containing-hemolysin-like protein